MKMDSIELYRTASAVLPLLAELILMEKVDKNSVFFRWT
jgi:hypothetical protein